MTEGLFIIQSVRDLVLNNEDVLSMDDDDDDEWSDVLSALASSPLRDGDPTDVKMDLAYAFCMNEAEPYFARQLERGKSSSDVAYTQLDTDDGHGHLHFNPTVAATVALTRGVSLNNEGHRLLGLHMFAEAEAAFTEAMRLKRAAFPTDSVHTCIGLSGLAEVQLAWGKAAGDVDRLESAAKYAREVLAIAKRMGDREQQRVAREILVDVADAMQDVYS